MRRCTAIASWLLASLLLTAPGWGLDAVTVSSVTAAPGDSGAQVEIRASLENPRTLLAFDVEFDGELCAALTDQSLQAGAVAQVMVEPDGIGCPDQGRLRVVLGTLNGDIAIPAGEGVVAVWSFDVGSAAEIGAHPLTVTVRESWNGPISVAASAQGGLLHIVERAITTTPADAATRTQTPTATNSPTGTATAAASAIATATLINTPTQTHTAIETATATASLAASPSLTPSPTAISSPSRTPTIVEVTLHTAAGLPGGRGCIATSLRNHGHTTAEAVLSVSLDPALTLSACAINANIAAGTGANKQLTIDSPQPGVHRVRIAGSPGALPDGTLFSCQVTISPEAVLGPYDLDAVVEMKNAEAVNQPTAATVHPLIVSACSGDCDGSGVVSIGEVVRALNLFGGMPLCNPGAPLQSCPSADRDHSEFVSIGEVVQTLNRFSAGCPAIH